jgi:hypothetical protein
MLAVVEAAGGLVDSYPTGKHNILQRIRTMRNALDAKDKEIKELKVLRANTGEKWANAENLLAQAAAVLEQVTDWWDDDGPHRTEPNMVTAARITSPQSVRPMTMN